jgi:hypothetical protein
LSVATLDFVEGTAWSKIIYALGEESSGNLATSERNRIGHGIHAEPGERGRVNAAEMSRENGVLLTPARASFRDKTQTLTAAKTGEKSG